MRSSRGATYVVDIATLTGTVRRALGDRHVGAFANDDHLFEMLQKASKRSGESFWRLPVDEEYSRGIESSLVADLNESGGDAGASVGAKFIQQFVDGRPWIHLDIVGLSWPAYTPPYRGAGPTGGHGADACGACDAPRTREHNQLNSSRRGLRCPISLF